MHMYVPDLQEDPVASSGGTGYHLLRHWPLALTQRYGVNPIYTQGMYLQLQITNVKEGKHKMWAKKQIGLTPNEVWDVDQISCIKYM